jgi:hypothetical protein
MEVDSFRYLSRLIRRYYRLTQVDPEYPIPWAPLGRPLSRSRFALVTSGGLYHKGSGPPFDLAHERAHPTWGDPGYRAIPTDAAPCEIGVSHFHINQEAVLEDINILLPLQRFQELASEGRVGSLGPHAYSFMGYQGFPADLTGWKQVSGPQVAGRMMAEEVDCVLLTAA